MGLNTLILASQSPRRRSLLAGTGRSFCVIPALGVPEEAPRESAEPAALAVRNALAKARAVARSADALRLAPAVVIGCDTIACVPGAAGDGVCEILGKPADRADARRMLGLLSGSEHFVISGLALIELPLGRETVDSVVTTLAMDKLADSAIDAYLESGAWRGKAGAFGYQDGIPWLRILSGSASNVVGLPMERLTELLDELERKDAR